MQQQQQKVWWCHGCQKTVQTAADAELCCPSCGSDFLEELPPSESPSPPPPAAAATQTTPQADPFMQSILQLFNNVSARRQQRHQQQQHTEQQPQQQRVFRLEFGPGGLFRVSSGEGGAAVPVQLLRMLQQPFGELFHGGALAEDGADFDALLQRLFLQHQARGTPPAARSAVAALRRETLGDGADAGECAVCQDAFAAGDATAVLPCGHRFHSDCIAPWLDLHNSCPSCRFELPTDDPDYERQRLQQRQQRR